MRHYIDIITETYDTWEDDDDDAPELRSYTLEAGEVVLHGTNGDFEERHGLNGPVWVTNSEQVFQGRYTRAVSNCQMVA